MSPDPAPTFIGLGSNLGDRMAQLRAATAALADLEGVEVVASSPVVRSAPWGLTDQPEFYNAVLACRSGLEPDALLAHLQAIEAAAGRQRDVPWGPRTLDLDLLVMGGLQRTSPDLTLPHPHIARRRFVLVGMAALAPSAVLPGTGQTFAALLTACPDPGEVVEIAAPLWPVDQGASAST